MKSIENLITFDGNINEELFTVIITSSVFVSFYICFMILGIICDISQSYCLTMTIGLTYSILTIFEDYFTSLIVNQNKENINTYPKNYKVLKPKYKKTIKDKAKICFDITGVIKPLYTSNSLPDENMINNLSKIVKIFGSENVHLLGSGTFKDEWVIKGWLEKNKIIKETGILRKNIHFLKNDKICRLSEIDKLKAIVCKEKKITHYIDDRESALQIISNNVNTAILFTDSKFEIDSLNNSIPFYNNPHVHFCNHWNDLYKIILKSYDQYYNRKTNYPDDCHTEYNDDLLNSYKLNYLKNKYLVIPIQDSFKSVKDDIAFVLLDNDHNSRRSFEGASPEVGYISYSGEIMIMKDNHNWIQDQFEFIN